MLCIHLEGVKHLFNRILFTPQAKHVLPAVFCEAEYVGIEPFLKMHFQKTAQYRHICEQYLTQYPAQPSEQYPTHPLAHSLKFFSNL